MILVTIQCCVDVLPFMPLGLRSFNITLTPFSPTWIGDLTRLTPQFYQYQQIYRLLTQSKATDTWCCELFIAGTYSYWAGPCLTKYCINFGRCHINLQRESSISRWNQQVQSWNSCEDVSMTALALRTDGLAEGTERRLSSLGFPACKVSILCNRNNLLAVNPHLKYTSSFSGPLSQRIVNISSTP